MTERDEYRRSREEKLDELKGLGLPLLPRSFGSKRSSAEILGDFKTLEGQSVKLAGRLMRVRLMGKAAFAHLQDESGQIQLYIKLDVVGQPLYEYFKLLDLGDIVGAEGRVFRTRTGEISVEVSDLVILAKAYQPLPDKYHGLTDVEMRYRRRYLDLIANQDVRRTFRLRSEIIRCIRRYLDGLGYMEVETPTLQPLYGGAAATPFVSRYESLDMDVYLRIATELYLKRLIVGGFEKVYEIGKDFRNEGFSRKHSPEFTMLELYEAYADYHDIMELCEDLIATTTLEVLGTHRVEYMGQEIDLSPPWQRFSIRDVVLEKVELDLHNRPERDELARAASTHGVRIEHSASGGKIVEEIVSQLVEPYLINPTILYDFPIDYPGSLLASRKPDNPHMVERFESYMAGMEFSNAFTELNDAEDQRRRMEEATRLTGEEHAAVDKDFVLALSHGMPPTGGIGIGLDRVIMVLTGATHIRETILFPLLRHREDDHAEP